MAQSVTKVCKMSDDLIFWPLSNKLGSVTRTITSILMLHSLHTQNAMSSQNLLFYLLYFYNPNNYKSTYKLKDLLFCTHKKHPQGFLRIFSYHGNVFKILSFWESIMFDTPSTCPVNWNDLHLILTYFTYTSHTRHIHVSYVTSC